MDSFLNFLWWLAIFATFGAGLYLWYAAWHRQAERKYERPKSLLDASDYWPR